MLPLTAGFVIMGPLSGWLSDKYGSRWFATSGLLLIALSFMMLAALPYNFEYPIFAIALLVMGIGNGMFGSPNVAAIMNSVPRKTGALHQECDLCYRTAGWLFPWPCFLPSLS